MPKDNKYPKKDVAKKLFMESVHYSWRPFCESLKWNHTSARMMFPVVDWINEKIALQNEQFGAEIDGMMAEQSEHWYREVSKTIREYPKMIDAMAQVVAYRNNQFLKMIQSDIDKGTDLFKKVSSGQIRNMTQAIKNVAEAKYHSLMLSEMKIKEFERKPTGETKVVFEIAGGGDAKNIKKIMEDWNNK